MNRFIKGRIDKPKRDYGVNAFDDAEAMLSLLSEEIIEGCVTVRGISSRRGSC